LQLKGAEFLKSGSLDYVNYGRSVLFVKSVLGQYCEAKTKRAIWLSVGNGHEKETECLLKKYLPVKTEAKLNLLKIMFLNLMTGI